MSSSPVVIVTGAAGGIGFATVGHLIKKHNARVVASDIVAGSLDELAKLHPQQLRVQLGDITKVSRLNLSVTEIRAIQI